MPDEVLTAKEVINYFLDDKFVPRDIFHALFHGKNEFIFRGVSDDSENLPKVFRNEDALRDFAPQTAGPPAADGYLGWHMRAEMRAVSLFLEEADKLGLDPPLDYDVLKECFESAFPVRGSVGRIIDQPSEGPFPYSKMLPAFALAQHYGVPTRLLDWTESPFVAAWFAAYRASQACPECERITSEHFFVHFLHKNACDVSLEIVTVPRTRNPNLLAQKALFLHFVDANTFFLEHVKWPSLEDWLEKTGKRDYLDKVKIPTSEADELLRLLWCFDITRESLMPSLDRAAQAFSYRRRLFSSD